MAYIDVDVLVRNAVVSRHTTDRTIAAERSPVLGLPECSYHGNPWLEESLSQAPRRLTLVDGNRALSRLEVDVHSVLADRANLAGEKKIEAYPCQGVLFRCYRLHPSAWSIDSPVYFISSNLIALTT